MHTDLKTAPEVIYKKELNDSNNNVSDSKTDTEKKVLKTQPESKLYLIYINGVTKFYEKTLESTKNKIQEMANYLIELNPDWTYYIETEKDGSINITRRCNLFIVSYESPYAYITYEPIYSIDIVKKEE